MFICEYNNESDHNYLFLENLDLFVCFFKKKLTKHSWHDNGNILCIVVFQCQIINLWAIGKKLTMECIHNASFITRILNCK